MVHVVSTLPGVKSRVISPGHLGYAIVRRKTSNNIDNKKEQTMSSRQRRIADIERESVRVRINLYKQMKEQLLLQVKLYHGQRKEELAKLIFDSLAS
jgi:hypothetical protein